MAYHNSSGGPPRSSAVEDYSKAIYALEHRAGRPVSTNAQAGRLGVTPASASGMVKRLGELGLVTHQPYHGVSLTDAGRQVVLSFGIPFALVPLVVLTGRRDVMGAHVNRRLLSLAAYAIAAAITAMNAYLIAEQLLG